VLARKGKKVVVLEANTHAGGRVQNVEVAGAQVEAGGQWVEPAQKHVMRLLNSYGLKTFDTYSTGDARLQLGDHVTSFATGSLPALPAKDLAAVGKAVATLEGYAKTIRPEAVWASPHAAELDAWTVAGWAAANIETPLAQLVVGGMLAGAGGWPATSASLLFCLFVAHTAGGVTALTSTRGVLKARVVGGTGLLVDALVRELGRRVVVGAPARRIEHTEHGVTVRSDKGVYTAAHAIVAVPPGMAGKIDYEPNLPPLRTQLMQRAPMGWAVKVFTAYPSPFWRDAGLSGIAQCAGFPTVATFDESPADGSPGVLYNLIAGDNATKWSALAPAARKEAVLRQLVPLFGPQAAKPIDYREANWALVPYIEGSAAAFFPPGALTGYGPALRAPVGRIHWASTETATNFWGDMDGAISAGERAAAETMR
jgi:monoamine oxidase